MSDEKVIVHQISEEKDGQISNYYLDGELYLNVDHASRIVATVNQQSRRFENQDDLQSWVAHFNRCVLRKRKAYRPEFTTSLIVDECFLETKKNFN
jgi:hypothetical protein